MAGLFPILLYVITTASGLIAIKLGSANGAVVEFIGNKLAFNLTPVNIAGLFLYGTSFALYTFLIAKNELGYIIPLTTGLVYVIIFIASFIIFKESFTIIKLLAITMILSGVVLLNLPMSGK